MFSTNYYALFEHHTDAILVVNEQRMIVEANNAFLALTQWEQVDFSQHTYETFFQFEENRSITSYDQRAHVICKDGHQVPILIQKVQADGYFFIVLKDMRALDAIAENYLQSQLHYRTIAENIQDVLILMDADKNYLYVSPSAQAMFDFDYRNLNNRSAFFNIHEDDVERLETCYNEAVTEKRAFTIKVQAWHEAHGWVWTEMNGTPMYEADKFQHMLLVARDVSTQHTYEERLLYDAHYDALTNLPNRRKLNALLEQYELALQHNEPFAVMLMDIDNFKHINDYYGHEIGDHVLVEYGNRVATLLEQQGVVGRYGGDEFLVLFRYETQQQVEQLAAQIVKAMQQPIDIQQTTLAITTSVGIACIEQPVAIRTMIKCADDALYRVKERGKNSWYIANVLEGKHSEC